MWITKNYRPVSLHTPMLLQGTARCVLQRACEKDVDYFKIVRTGELT